MVNSATGRGELRSSTGGTGWVFTPSASDSAQGRQTMGWTVEQAKRASAIAPTPSEAPWSGQGPREGSLYLPDAEALAGLARAWTTTPAIHAVLDGRGHILFVPFAIIDQDTCTGIMREALARVGAQVTSLHEVSDVARAVRDAEAVFVGGWQVIPA